MSDQKPLSAFAERLCQFREDCGAPSVRLLTQLLREAGRVYPRSTISDKLAGVSKPSWEFVEDFVRVCARHADREVDLGEWRGAYRRMLHDLAAGRGGIRRAGAARPEPSAPGGGPAGGTARRPLRQLPADVYPFTGRAGELAALDELLRTSASAGSLAVVSGTAGVGKTALAVHWAHRVAELFPDGQLYVDLRGYDAETEVSSAQALEGFLYALDGADPHRRGTLEDRAARFRSIVAGRRILLLLDNANSVEQLRPLLPGTTSCFVLVTSRDRLPGLAARQGARRVDLDRLPLAESVRLLAALVGRRVDAEPDAAVVLAERCARLPLALRIAGEFAVERPATTLAEVAESLADERRRLDLLHAGGDARTDVRVVFSWSYGRLDTPAKRLFRLLALHPGRDFDRHSLSALAGLTLTALHRPLDTLLRTHLLQRADDDRLELHDLLRAYAAELLGDDERTRFVRLLDYYRRAASLASTAAFPADPPRPLPAHDGPLPTLTTEQAARTWLDDERANLVALVEYAARHDHPAPVADLSAILWRYLDSGAHHVDAATIHGAARTAAHRIGDAPAEAEALHRLGTVAWRAGRETEAVDHLLLELGLRRMLDDRAGAAIALKCLDLLHDMLVRYGETMGPSAQATRERIARERVRFASPEPDGPAPDREPADESDGILRAQRDLRDLQAAQRAASAL